ncbi:unnamed protein product [Brachionus calyciflorus]|uniref:Uncharacterized protein n=1 Tax=Brachionus calyciflorus TaxID=104777 RepID=A0A814RV75_9BILA|nr:unnamed protein product [Brachionus calyciflorus]
MSFYVTLPSNSSMDLYPENTMTDFSVLLKEPIRLDVQYEVALVELTYKHSWSLEVDYQYVGDAYAPLLRSVVVDNSYLKTAWVNYDNPHYLNVNKYYINNIKVEIRDDTGKKIRFENGRVIVKLHFRPKQV